jgi:hypothetical protein
MDIQPFVDIDAKIEKGKLIFTFTANGNEITDLRVLDFIAKMENIIQDLHQDSIQKAYFLFDIENLRIPANFASLKLFADTMNKHKELLTKKLDFTIVQTTNNVFRIFFSLFKQYYNPVKPLYLCKSSEESVVCLHDSKKRISFPNIMNLLLEKEDSRSGCDGGCCAADVATT